MWHLVSFLVFTLCSLLSTSLSVFGDESSDSTSSLHANDEYSHIHRSIPVLFEYLLVALEGKPEVLESNSAVAFNDQINDDSIQSKRDADYKDYDFIYGEDYTEFSEDFDELNKFNEIRALADNDDKDGLKPEDIEQKVLLAEKKLEEHNNKEK